MASADESSDLRQFLREQTLRHDRIWRGLREELRAGQAILEAQVQQTARLVQEMATHSKVLDNEVSELTAHREALFRILDRLPDPGGRGGAAA
jgi:hypothetical protein